MQGTSSSSPVSRVKPRTAKSLTLGAGGSDLTAIALAAAVKADLCQIYTDVDGVFTPPTRGLSQIQQAPEISYDEMLELASLGAKVMQSRSVGARNLAWCLRSAAV